MKEIKRMQENLLLIRRVVGWTAAEFGEKIGVTRQTINNIENGRNNLNKTQYIAVRSVLDAEISRSPGDTEMLVTLLEVVVDNPENYSENVRKELVEKANLMAPGILVGSASREKVSKEWMSIVGVTLGAAMLLPSPVVAGMGLVAVGNWLKKLVNKTDENNDAQKNSQNKHN